MKIDVIYPVEVINKKDAKPGQVYAIGKEYYLALVPTGFARLSDGCYFSEDGMASNLTVVDARVVVE